LPPPYQDIFDFAYCSGWRRREITELTWAEVDWRGGVVRLDPQRSKTGAGRVLPLSRALRAVVERRLMPGALFTMTTRTLCGASR
jgi:integrase